MIKAHALTRKYSHKAAVQDVSFEIKTQEVVALLGQNGAGKTTLMKMLTGFLEPTIGSVSIGEFDLATNREEAQRTIGYLPENCPLYLDMTVLEYLNYAADLRGVKDSDKAVRITYAMNRTALVDVARSVINTLSRGYRQRIGMAQALLNSPSVLLLDEPTNGLDPSQILEMRSLIKELAKNATIIVSTHNLQEVQEFCTRVIILDKGRIVIDDRVSDLRQTHSIEVFTDAHIKDLEAILAGFINMKVSINGADLSQSDHAAHGADSLNSPHGEHYRYIIDVDVDSDINPDRDNSQAVSLLSNALQEAGFKIFGVQSIVRDLETIFADITSGKSIDGFGANLNSPNSLKSLNNDPQIDT